MVKDEKTIMWEKPAFFFNVGIKMLICYVVFTGVVALLVALLKFLNLDYETIGR